MNKLDRHIITAIIASTLVALFALLSIDILGKFIYEFGFVGRKSYTLLTAIKYVFGLMPMQLILFFPMALLIGALMGLGALASANELTVMLVSGVSRFRLAILGFLVSLLMGASVLLINEFVGVQLNQSVEEMRADALGYNHNYAKNGIWAQDGNRFVNIKGIKSDGKLANVTIYTLDEKMSFEKIITAKSAIFRPKNWLLSDVTIKHLKEQEIEIKKHKALSWENQLNNEIIGLLLTDPEELSIRDLYKYSNYQKANGIKSTNYALTFWQRIFLPLSTGVMFLLALPFVFGSQRNNSQGRKLFIGILLGIAYYIAYQSIANLILLTGVPVILGAIIPIALFCLISFGLLWIRG